MNKIKIVEPQGGKWIQIQRRVLKITFFNFKKLILADFQRTNLLIRRNLSILKSFYATKIYSDHLSIGENSEILLLKSEMEERCPLSF